AEGARGGGSSGRSRAVRRWRQRDRRWSGWPRGGAHRRPAWCQYNSGFTQFERPAAGQRRSMVERVALITDSSACIPARARLDLQIVPIVVQVGAEDFRDGVDLEPNRLYAALEKGLPVKSAAPSPLDYLDAIEAADE